MWLVSCINLSGLSHLDKTYLTYVPQKSSVCLRNFSLSTCSVKVITQPWIPSWSSEQKCLWKSICFNASLGTCFLFLNLWWVLVIVSPITKLGFGTASVLFPTLITFYKIYCVLGIAIKCLVYVISFVRILLFKSWSFFHQLTQLTRRPLLTAWTRIVCYIYLR